MLLLIPWLAFISCRDVKENLPPVIGIESPYDDELFKPGDTIQVAASISDDGIINKVQVQLVRDDYIPCAKLLEFQPEKSDYQIQTLYIIPEDVVWADWYYILVRAYDEDGYKNKYRRIRISPKTESYRGLLLITQDGPMSKSIYHLDTTQIINKISTHISDSGSAAFWPGMGLVSMAGRIYGDLVSIRPADSTTLWTIPAIPDPPHPYFHDIAYFSGKLFVCFEEGYVAAWTPVGTKTLQTPSISSHFPTTLCFEEDYLTVFWKDRSNTGGFVGRHYLSSGHQQEAIAVPFRVLKMINGGSGDIWLFYQESGQAKAKKISAGSLQNWISLPAGEFRDAIWINQGQFLLSLSSGCFLIDESGQAFQVLDSYQSGLLSFDSSLNRLYSAKDSKVFIRDMAGGGVQSITFPNPVQAVFPWYQY